MKPYMLLVFFRAVTHYRKRAISLVIYISFFRLYYVASKGTLVLLKYFVKFK